MGAFDVRLATPDDAAAIAGIYRPIVELTPISFETDPPGASDMARRIDETLRFYPWLAGEYDGRVIGYAYAARHRVRTAYQWSVDTSVYIDAAFRQRGVGRALYTSLFRILAAQGLVNAYAGITLPNPGSVALHESAGFRPLGIYRRVGFKLGAWHDVGWWQMELQTHAPAPPQPVGIDVLQRQPAWPALVAADLSALGVPLEDRSAGSTGEDGE